MPATISFWEWEDAFSKFGFGDGDGDNHTDEVAEFLQTKFGFECETDTWGMHNYMIMDVKKDGQSIQGEIQVGYADPRTWLPKDIIAALDAEFPSVSPERAAALAASVKAINETPHTPDGTRPDQER